MCLIQTHGQLGRPDRLPEDPSYGSDERRGQVSGPGEPAALVLDGLDVAVHAVEMCDWCAQSTNAG